MGILSGLKHWIENAGTADQQTGLSGWDKLSAVGAGLKNLGDPTGEDNLAPYKAAVAATRATNQGREQAAYLDDIGQRIGLTPGERLLMRVSPEKAAEVMAKKLSPLVVGGQVFQDGEFTAPTDYKVDDGRAFSIGPQGLQPLGNLDPSFGEQTAREKAARDAQIELQRLTETQRHNRTSEDISQGNLGVARGNLGLSQQRFKRGEGGGSLSTMTDQQLIDLAKGLK